MSWKIKMFSAEHRRKLSESHKGQIPSNLAQLRVLNTGEGNANWKGDSVGYTSIHQWVVRRFGNPTKCEHCGLISESNRRIHWASKTHKYLREKDDWMRLCVTCHWAYDKKMGWRKYANKA